MRRRHAIVSLALALLACAFVATASGQGEAGELEIRTFDLGVLTSPIADARAASWEMPLRRSYRRYDPEDAFDLRSGETAPLLLPEQIVDLLRAAVAPESWTLEGRSMRLSASGDALVVRQSGEVLGEISAFLRYFCSELRRPLSVEALVLGGEDLALAELLDGRRSIDSEAFDALVEGGDPRLRVVASARAQGLPGQTLRLSTGRVRRFVGTLDVEVAQSAKIADPAPRRLHEGLRAEVRVDPLGDGRVLVRLTSEYVHDYGIDEVETRATSLGTVQLPRLRVEKVGTAAALRPGDCLVVGAGGEGQGSDRVLVLRAVGAEAAREAASWGPSRRRTVSWNFGAVLAPFLSLPRPSLGRALAEPGHADEWLLDAGPLAEERALLDVDGVTDLVRELVGVPARGVAPGAVLDSRGRVWAQLPSSGAERIGAALAALEARRARSVRMDFRLARVERRRLATRRQSSGSDWPDVWWRQDPSAASTRLSVRSEIGGMAQVVSGREYAFLADYDAEIAQGAEIGAPVVQTGFAGLDLRVAVLDLEAAADREEFSVHYQAVTARDAGAPVPFSGGSVDYGVLHLPAVEVHRAEGEVRMKPGRARLLARWTDVDDPGQVWILLGRLRLDG